jgi:hypothetical protein
VRYRVLLTKKEVTAEIVPNLALSLASQDPGWIDLRQRLARAARELHFVAFTDELANATYLLSISERFAELALSIPARPEEEAPAIRFQDGLVNATTLFAAHLLHYDEGTCGEPLDVPANE